MKGSLQPGKWLRAIAWCALAVLFFSSFGILRPGMPNPSLDGSWMYAANQAEAQGLAFGRDIVFTVGPYAAVYTHAYHPGTVWIMVVGCLLLDLCYASCFIWLVRRAHWSWPLILAALVVTPLIRPDVFFFSFLLLLALVLFQLHDEAQDNPAKPSTVLWLAALFACSGMLPFVKVSFAIAELGVFAICLCFLALHRRWTMALICFLSLFTGMLVFWVAAGQKLADLPAFFSASLPIISGYSQAMSQSGPLRDQLLFLLGALGILLLIVFARQFQRQQKYFLFLVYASYIFVTFKEGFDRHDDYHSAIAQGGLAVGVLSLTLLQTPKCRHFSAVLCLAVFVIALLPMGFMWHSHFESEPEVSGLAPQPENAPQSAPLAHMSTDLGARILRKLGLLSFPGSLTLGPWNAEPWTWHRRFDEARQAINADSQLDFSMPGSVDMYSDQQSALLSRDYSWDPRLVFQSYSAYTPSLIRRNEQHLRGAATPDHIVLKLDTIDDRLPALDDGLSWPAMLDNYRVAEAANGWVHLTRKPGPLRRESRFTSLGTASLQLGQEVVLPSSNGPIFVQIDLNPNLYGRLVDTVYKLPLLSLTLLTDDGQRGSYRVIAGMMKTGFFVSPLITDNDGFVRLFDASQLPRKEDKVRSLRLDASGAGWLDTYTITFRKYEY